MKIRNFSLSFEKYFTSERSKQVNYFFQHKKRNFRAAMLCSIYHINTNEIPNHYMLIVFCFERCDLLFSHSNGDISCVKITGYIFHISDIMFSRESSPGISLVFI